MLLNEKLNGRRLILASGSPRRSELMRGCGLTFTVADKFGVDEVYPASMPATEVPAYLAGLKSDGYPLPLEPQDILITADTVVILDGQILGKPDDGQDAARMLRRLQGKKHTVVTGVVLRDTAHRRTFSCSAVVKFGTLTKEQIEYYVANFSPMDKAGSYAIQEWIGYVGIEAIEGSFYNVMGLPTQQLCEELEDFIK